MTGGPFGTCPASAASRVDSTPSSRATRSSSPRRRATRTRCAPRSPYPNARVARWRRSAPFGGRWGATRARQAQRPRGAVWSRGMARCGRPRARSVDELCALPPNVSFAAAPNAGFRARTCFDPNGGRGAAFNCQTCAADDDGGGGAKPRCRCRLNSAVSARSAPPSLRRVVRPVQAGAVGNRDGGDQGAYNTLLYTHALFGAVGAGARVLPSTYNALARVQKLRPKEWAAMAAGGPSLVHFSRETSRGDCTPTRRRGARGTPRARRRRRRRCESGSTRVRLASSTTMSYHSNGSVAGENRAAHVAARRRCRRAHGGALVEDRRRDFRRVGARALRRRRLRAAAAPPPPAAAPRLKKAAAATRRLQREGRDGPRRCSVAAGAAAGGGAAASSAAAANHGVPRGDCRRRRVVGRRRRRGGGAPRRQRAHG